MCRPRFPLSARFCTWRFAGRSARRRWFRRHFTSGRKKWRRRPYPERIEINPRSGLMAYPKTYRYTKEHEWIEVKVVLVMRRPPRSTLLPYATLFLAEPLGLA